MPERGARRLTDGGTERRWRDIGRSVSIAGRPLHRPVRTRGVSSCRTRPAIWRRSPTCPKQPRPSDACADVPILVVAPASVATSTSPDAAHSTAADRARLRAGPWALLKQRWRTFAGTVLNALPGRLRTAAPHGHDECTAPQRKPGIPEVCVPGKSMLVGIVCSLDHTRVDEPASDAECAAVDGEPDRRCPSQRPRSP